jgi:hypothetical protein
MTSSPLGISAYDRFCPRHVAIVASNDNCDEEADNSVEEFVATAK